LWWVVLVQQQQDDQLFRVDDEPEHLDQLFFQVSSCRLLLGLVLLAVVLVVGVGDEAVQVCKCKVLGVDVHCITSGLQASC